MVCDRCKEIHEAMKKGLRKEPCPCDCHDEKCPRKEPKYPKIEPWNPYRYPEYPKPKWEFPRTYEIRGVEQPCLIEQAARYYQERGLPCPPLCISCPCPKCSPRCSIR